MSPYYKYKKEKLEKKFYVAKDTLALLIGAMNEFTNTKNSLFNIDNTFSFEILLFLSINIFPINK